MFNDFSLSDEEILKIIEEYKPLILSRSKINFKFDEDLYQEIMIVIFKNFQKIMYSKIFKICNIDKIFDFIWVDKKEVYNMESKTQELMDIDSAIAYAQLAVHTLQNSATEVNAKELRSEIKMSILKFGTSEVKRLANIIVKGKIMCCNSNYFTNYLLYNNRVFNT